MTDEPRYWFHAKRYGWGWGPPSTWEGWLVLVAYIALMGGAALALNPARHPGYFTGFVVAITLALVGICWWKGEPPEWRWGTKRDGRSG